jgi:predicted GH43/DUF377 family glycosyl hydrolase
MKRVKIDLRLFDKCLISPDDVAPSQKDFTVIGTFNPGVVRFKDTTYLLIRVAEAPQEKRDGYFPLPRIEKGKIVIDWIENKLVNQLSKKSVAVKPNNYRRLTNVSHLRLAKSRDGTSIDFIDQFPTFFPEKPYEELGIEDARITPIDDRFYITYVAVSRGYGITTALASTKDFVDFKRHGIIFPDQNKDVVIFPEKIKGFFTSLHRPMGANPYSPPKIWMASSTDLIYWGDHNILKQKNLEWDSMKIGAGTPPIRTQHGWLEIYHGVYKVADKDIVYSAGALLLDLHNPQKIIGATKKPILSPTMDYETLKQESIYENQGFLKNIVFPTGIVNESDDLFIYSGTADTYTAVTKLSLEEIIDAVR